MAIEKVSARSIKKAAALIKAGGVVAFPTETVYGLAANLERKKAINRLFEVKKRSHGKHFSLHISDKEQIEIVDQFVTSLNTLLYGSNEEEPDTIAVLPS